MLCYSYLLPSLRPKHLKEKLLVLKLRTSASFMDMNVLALRFKLLCEDESTQKIIWALR